MDASRLAITFAVLLIGAGIGRFVLTTAARAGDGMASLFVPPDQTLGWPHGVQEGDEPWGWRAPAAAGPVTATNPFDDSDSGGPSGGDPSGDVRSGSFSVPVGRVRPIRLTLRPH